MTLLRLLAAGLLGTAATFALAQPGPAGGPGPGPCAAAPGASGVPADCPRGGMGMGMHRGGGRWGKDYTPGWPMMSADERQAHRQQMRSFTNYEECKAYMDKHHDEMAARAKERGIALPAKPRRDACAGLKAPAK